MTASDIHTRLLEEARRYDPATHHRSPLDQFRDVILLQRAKSMSYEQIAGAFTRNGFKISGPGVAGYCRRTFPKAEILRERQRLETELLKEPAITAPSLGRPSTVAKPEVPPAMPGKRGPKIARDNY